MHNDDRSVLAMDLVGESVNQKHINLNIFMEAVYLLRILNAKNMIEFFKLCHFSEVNF